MTWADRMLRWIAERIVRGPDARFILGDLDEILERERAATPWGARRRYAMNALGSAASTARGRLRAALERLPSLGFSWLDLKLGLRMLVKYPGLTLVAVFALALGIPASLVPMHFLTIFDAELPFDEAERIVGVRHLRTEGPEQYDGSAHEYRVWRDGLTSFEAVAAAHAERHNVIADDGQARAYRVGIMTASAFDIVRVPPRFGRPLVAADEAPGAPDVVVVGHEAWETLLDGDPRAVGRTLRIGDRPHVVVGVMPEGFLFPSREHVWIPLRGVEAALAGAPGPELWIFGRLADGVSRGRAQAELSAFRTGLAAEFPDVYGRTRAEVTSYTTMVTGNPARLFWYMAPFQLAALLLLAVACGNVGTLVFARTVARAGEVSVRTALGASRARIVSQLFAEALVLALLATGVGLLLADVAADRFGRLVDAEGIPFWLDVGLNGRTVALALALAVFSSVIAGVLPALKATGRGIQGSLQRSGAGRSGTGFGRATTALIVTEVALGVMCLFVGAVGYRWASWNDAPTMEIRPEQFLTAAVRIPGPASETPGEAQRAAGARFQDELVRRLEAEPGVQGVALTRWLPGQGHPDVRIEVEGADTGPAGAEHVVALSYVDVGYFAGLGHGVLQGRDFASSDLPASADEASPYVIVNTTFVERVLRGGNAIGRRVRFPASGDWPGSPWYEIVGVVGRMGTITNDPLPDDAAFYQPVPRGRERATWLAIRLTSDPSAFAPRLRELAAAVDPTVIVDEPLPLSEVRWVNGPWLRWTVLLVVVVAGIAVVLSVAGLYALMSFTVAQRTREIGVRTALGASARRIMSVVARRAATQLALGVAIGSGVVAAVITSDDVFRPTDPALSPFSRWPLILAAAAAFIAVVAIVACIGPTLRGLRIKPMEAIRG